MLSLWRLVTAQSSGHGDMQRALLHLPQPQREALILVGAGGFAYEEAAEICQVAVGTIKSRVARGRVALEAILTEGKLPSRRDYVAKADVTALGAHGGVTLVFDVAESHDAVDRRRVGEHVGSAALA